MFKGVENVLTRCQQCPNKSILTECRFILLLKSRNLFKKNLGPVLELPVITLDY